MRGSILIAWTALVFSSARVEAAPPRVAYVIEEVPGSWQPLEPADIAKTIEHAALEVLSKPGLIQLEKSAKRSKPEEKADYVLLIEGRTVDEAETHTVYLTFGPGVRTDIASFRSSNTVALGKQARAAMLSAIEGSARKAAAELLDVLKPQLEMAKGGKTGSPKDPSEGKEVPWRWPEVDVPRVSSGRAALGLYSKNRDERHASLRELTSLALTEASPRNVLEGCVLKHTDAEIRLGCLQALRPLSRKIAPTQRVVVEAFRKDAQDNIRKEADEQMMYFAGLARQEAIQAWLESLSKCRYSGPLEQLGDIANLDLAVQRCLMACGKKEKYQRSKRMCIEALKPVPVERRRRILWKYLEETNPDSPLFIEGAGEREGSTGADWQWSVEAVLEGATKWDPALEEILWKRYQRTLSSASLDILADYAPPSPKLMERMLEVLQTAGARDALRSLQRIGEEDASLRPQIVERLAELLVTNSYPKTINKNDLEQVMERLKKEKKQ
jgi:hypothetical protein